MADITVSDQGSIVLLTPNTDLGVSWIEENIGADNGYQPYYPVIVVEHRYADDVIDGMIGDGLEVD